MTSNAPQLPLREKISYGFGDFASVLFWQTFMLYLTFYYTDVFGLGALAAAAMVGLSRLLDAFFDPVIGMIGDRTNTRWGKYRPYLIWGCVPFAIFGVLTFSPAPAGIASSLEAHFGGIIRHGYGAIAVVLHKMAHLFSLLHIGFASSFFEGFSSDARSLQGQVTGSLVWALLTYNGLMLLYTFVNIPYTAMLGVLTPNTNERTSLSSIKFVGAFLGGITISFGLMYFVKTLSPNNPAHGWQLAFSLIGVIAIASFIVTFLGTKERVQPPQAQKTSVLRDLGDLFTNGPWVVLLFTTMFFILFVAARGSVTVHYFKYYVGTHQLSFWSWLPFVGGTREWGFEELVSWFNGTGQVASLVGVLLLPYFAKRVGKKTAFIVLFVIAIASTASYYLLGPNQLRLIFGLNLIGSITGGPLSALLWAMYADTADFAEWKRGRRATGLVFSAAIFCQKWGWGFGAAIALALMAHFGFQANVAQTPESLRALVKLMSTIPAALGIVALVILIVFYRLTERRVAEVEKTLAERRQATEAAGTASTAAATA